MRQDALKAVREEQTVQSVAAEYGVNERNVLRWLADFANGLQNALLAKPIPGPPSNVSAEELSWIASAVRDHNKQQFNFEFGLWTLSLIRHLIKPQFKRELLASSVHRLMKIVGLSAQKPLYKAWQQDPVLVRTWETKTYPAIRARAKRVGATIYFGDESAIRSDYHTGTTWAPQRPDAGGADDWPVLLAEHDLGGQHAGRVTVHATCRLGRREGVRRVPQALDGHCREAGISDCRWSSDPQGKDDQALRRRLGGKLTLFNLPPWSPHLNPDETVWAHVKRNVLRQLVENTEEMKPLTLGALRMHPETP